jgi:peptidoglycan/xylan/chitin deacetylase (PgdA/CDA1 family)
MQIFRFSPVTTARAAAVGLTGTLLAAASAHAAGCPGNPDAIGTSRTIVVAPGVYSRVGVMQYPNTLPLAEKEVVITFDDGPLPPASNQVLDTLAAQCVKATYFLVGEMARNFPTVVRRIHDEGHTIGTHSENHHIPFEKLPVDKLRWEIDEGIADVAAAAGNTRYVAPFFRIPGLGRSDQVESELAARSLVVFSSDTVADDWHRHITPNQIIALAVSRLQRLGKGILLLHDIHKWTAAALPGLFKALKDKGFTIVQVVGPEQAILAAGDTPREQATAPEQAAGVAAAAPVPAAQLETKPDAAPAEAPITTAAQPSAEPTKTEGQSGEGERNEAKAVEAKADHEAKADDQAKAAEAKVSEAKTTDTETADTKAAETKPAETNATEIGGTDAAAADANIKGTKTAEADADGKSVAEKPGPKKWLIAISMAGQLSIDDGRTEPTWPAISLPTAPDLVLLLPVPDASSFDPAYAVEPAAWLALQSDAANPQWPAQAALALPTADPELPAPSVQDTGLAADSLQPDDHIPGSPPNDSDAKRHSALPALTHSAAREPQEPAAGDVPTFPPPNEP